MMRHTGKAYEDLTPPPGAYLCLHSLRNLWCVLRHVEASPHSYHIRAGTKPQNTTGHVNSISSSTFALPARLLSPTEATVVLLFASLKHSVQPCLHCVHSGLQDLKIQNSCAAGVTVYDLFMHHPKNNYFRRMTHKITT